ncbi:hypothetical protein [Reichenbachiella versicolor]|uniref:hypothetical protein n=1 Tax=Reichenbachiella versicolor TaxID=1821036 RepID=UPI000D6E8DA5|nr:hypothetical protein [Reichenbachiella versicolor]
MGWTGISHINDSNKVIKNSTGVSKINDSSVVTKGFTSLSVINNTHVVTKGFSGISLERKKEDTVLKSFSGLSTVFVANLLVNIVNENGLLHPAQIEIYKAEALLFSKFTENGIMTFALPEAGEYKIKITDSDIKMSIHYDGANNIAETYTYLNKTIVYRVKDPTQDTYSGELAIHI